MNKWTRFYIVAVFSILGNEPLFSEDHIAILDGVHILRSEVQIDPKLALPHADELSNDELEAEIDSIERRLLKSKIYNLVVTRILGEFNVTVSKTEVDSYFDSRMKAAGFTQDNVNQINETSNLMLKTLEYALQNENLTDREIYDSMLSESDIPFSAWQISRRNYNSREKIAKMKSLIPSDMEDLKRVSYASTERDALLAKLKATLFPDISLSDEEKSTIRNHLKRESAKSQESFEMQVKTAIDMAVDEKRDLAWADFIRERYAVSELILKDEKHEAFLKSLGFQKVKVIPEAFR